MEQEAATRYGELAEEMRTRRPSLPVVFLAVGDGEWVSGERWVLRKPLAGRSLIDTLQAALGRPRETATRRSAQKV